MKHFSIVCGSHTFPKILVWCLICLFLYFLAMSFRLYALVCNSPSAVAIRIWPSVCNIGLIYFLLIS